MKTKTLRAGLEDLLKDAHNQIKGFDNGLFDEVLGPDIMTRVKGLKFPSDPFIKSFATNAEFAKSYTTNAKSDAVARIQGEFAAKLKVCVTAHTIFLGNSGKVMPKSRILSVADTTLDEMFVHSGREGMLGLARTWEAQQVKETNGQKPVLDKFLKSTQYQVLTKIGTALNDDAVKLNAAKSKLKSIKL